MTSLDLTPLQHCHQLEYIDLAEQKFQSNEQRLQSETRLNDKIDQADLPSYCPKTFIERPMGHTGDDNI